MPSRYRNDLSYTITKHEEEAKMLKDTIDDEVYTVNGISCLYEDAAECFNRLSNIFSELAEIHANRFK